MRRDISAPFGPYDFAVGKTSPYMKIFLTRLSCKTWERAFSAPGSVWLEQILGFQKDSDFIFDEISMLCGTKVHRQLEHCVKNILEKQQRISPIQFEYISPMVNNCSNFTYQQAFVSKINTFVSELFHQITDITTQQSMIIVATEQAIKNQIVSHGVHLWINGRIDLLLRDINGCYFIIDFKTKASYLPFTFRQISDGKFLQIVLYGAYYQSFGHDVTVQILSPFHREKTFHLNEIDPSKKQQWSNFWTRFSQLQQTMAFGHAENEFLAFSHSPLDTHVIDCRRAISGWSTEEKE
jgi:hypothetical protein